MRDAASGIGDRIRNGGYGIGDRGRVTVSVRYAHTKYTYLFNIRERTLQDIGGGGRGAASASHA